MTFQDAVIEYEVGKEIILINQDTFLSVFKAESMPHFQQEVLQVVKNGSVSYTHLDVYKRQVLQRVQTVVVFL